MGDYANALNGYLEGAELAQKIGNKRMLSIMNEDIASLYASQKDYEQALEYYKIVKRINEEINQEVNSAETFSNMASLYADMGKLEYAMFNINTSIATFEKEGITDWLAYAYEVKGKIYLKQQKFKWALFWYNQSELLHRQLEDERGEIDLLNGMAEAYFGLEQDSISKRYALKAFDISNGINFLEGRQKCAKTLYKISKKNNEYDTALSYHEIYQQLSDTLSRSENQKSLTLLKTKVEHERQKANLIIENEKQLATQRSYVNAALAILLIFVTVTFLVHRSEKIQKNLNAELKAKTKDLEENELELTALNETKDKLFSIIAHDLRGPIGAFQGLLDLFRNGEMGKEEFIDFIPKLGHDIDHISFTLNNLLTWGQSQMKGSVTRPAVIPVENIVDDNFNLLSEIAEGKSIKLVSNVPSNTLAWVDGDQLDIVIRNLISNALKFTKANGLVSVAAQEKTDHWEIAVRDTGIGMPKETVDTIFSKNTNITTYGTNNEKGTGLGLSLCKEMVEKNNGTIWVDSVPQQGSCFYFTVPKAKSSYQKAG
jgi:signal transduction histidine kinase